MGSKKIKYHKRKVKKSKKSIIINLAKARTNYVRPRANLNIENQDGVTSKKF